MEIVYCGDCGKSLRKDDFVQGKAGHQNDVPYCAECRPVKAVSNITSGTLKKILTTRMPRPGVPPTSRFKPRPEGRPAGSRLPLVIGGAFGGISLAALLLVLLTGRKDEMPDAVAVKTAPPGDRGSTAVAPRPGENDEARIREEERTREERRKREEEARRLRDQAQVDHLLGQARAIREADPRFARSGEVMELLKSALDLGGPRRAEAERVRAEYEKAFGESKQKALVRRKGPFELDGSGFIQNWLILGPFPNTEDKGFYTDFLQTEEQHEPAEGVEVQKAGGKVRWAPCAVEGGRIDFFKVPHLGLSDRQEFVIEYAACWLECDRDMDVEIRLGSDDGFRLWLDGELRMGQHLHRAVKEDDNACAVKLARGIHLVLIKVDQGDGDHGLVARVVTPEGNRPAGLRVWN